MIGGGNFLSPVTAPIISMLTRSKIRYFLLADVTGYYRYRRYLLTGVIIKVSTMGGRDVDFPKKTLGKKIS